MKEQKKTVSLSCRKLKTIFHKCMIKLDDCMRRQFFFRSCQFVDLLQEDGNAGAFLDHNKNLKKNDVRQTKRGLQRFSVFSGQECRKRRERDIDE